MNKITALHKRATFLRKAEASALTLWREPDWADIRPAIIEVRYKREKQIAKYWSNALSRCASDGLTNSLRGRTFLVIDEASRCLIGLLAYRNASKNEPMRDRMIGWAGEWRERRASRVIDLVRCLPTAPFVTLGGMKLLMQIAVCDEMVWLLEKRASMALAAMTFTVDDLDAVENNLPRIKDFEPPWLDQGADHIVARTTYLAELREGALRYLRGETDVLDGDDTTRPFKGICNTWQREALQTLVADKVQPWDKDAYCYERLIERYDRWENDGTR